MDFYKFKDNRDWQESLQEAPHANWIKERSLGSKKSKYVPLFIQQALADLIFKEFDVVGEEYKVIQNEIICTVKIQFLPSYPDSEHRYMTGVAAKPIQQASGTPASHFPDGKLTNALEYNAPAARSAAISNALTSFGNIFGRNLGRDTPNNFSFTRTDQRIAKEEQKKLNDGK